MCRTYGKCKILINNSSFWSQVVSFTAVSRLVTQHFCPTNGCLEGEKGCMMSLLTAVKETRSQEEDLISYLTELATYSYEKTCSYRS